MKVEFLMSFKNDLEKIKDKKLKLKLSSIIIALENSADFSQLNQIVKMKGHPSAYRMRIGDYRLGFYHENDVIKLARFVKRNDIYKLFP